MALMPSWDLSRGTGEGLAGGWWACLPIPWVPLGKWATLLWEI